jgi:hypothetical protein
MSEDNDRQGLTAEAGAWLDTAQACAFLGITDRTLFRRVSRGEIKRQLLPGRRSEFWIPGGTRQETHPDMRQDEPDESLAVMSQQLALLERQGEITALQIAPLMDELTRSRQQLTEQAEEIGRLKAELDAERGRAKLSDDTKRQPWWQRLFRGS